MLRFTWKSIAVLTVGVLLALAVGVPPEPPVAAQDGPGAQAELMDSLRSDGLTREQLAGLYHSLALGEFEPPACVADDEMFTDVPASSPFCPWIEELARRGITGGCNDTEYCPGNPVTRAQMAAFVVRAVADEASHVVGEPGEPAFGDGGEGDCLWQNPPPDLLPDVTPVSFFKDSDGIIHLAGVPLAIDGPEGDMTCNVETGDLSDLVIFELPAGYQPDHLELFASGPTPGGVIIVPEGGVTIDGEFIPGGSVLVSSTVSGGGAMTLGGVTFRAAPEATTSRQPREPASVSLRALRDLLD